MRINKSINSFAAVYAPLLAALLLFGSATTVAASDPTTVSVVGCSLRGGAVEVEGGTEIVLRSGWGATNRGLVEAFLNGGGRLILTVDGDVVDLSDFISTPQEVGGNWFVFFVYPAGILDSGDSMEVSFEVVIDHIWYDGETLFDPQTFVFACTVTAA